MIQLLGTLTIMEIALTALAILGSLWLGTTLVVLSRIKRRRALRAADELYAQMVRELDRLEAQLGSRKVRIMPPIRPRAHNASPPAAPDLLDSLNRQRISKLRARAQGLLRGLRFQRGAVLHRSCRALEGMAQDLRELALQIEVEAMREVPPAAPAARSASHDALRPSTQPAPEVV